MKNSTKLTLCLGIFMPIMLQEYVEMYGITPKFILGMLIFGMMLSGYRYFIIKEVLQGEHEQVVDLINKTIDKENESE